jgi:hypothetical protein
MLKHLFYFLAFFVPVLLLAGCANTADVKARLGEEIPLHVGQSVVVTGEDVKIRFVEVSEDSRCPKDVTCVWEGRVVAVVEVTSGSSPRQLELIQPGLTEEPAEETHQEYQLTFKVEPYPEEGQELAADDYTLVLIISR